VEIVVGVGGRRDMDVDRKHRAFIPIGSLQSWISAHHEAAAIDHDRTSNLR